MKKVAIIPLKSDSVRFPDKNFKFIDGKSLLMNTIDKLIESGIDIIIISTDKKEKIFYSLDTCKKPIHIFDRHDNLMGDARTELVVLDTISEAASRKIIELNGDDCTIVLTQVTSPLWKSHRLIQSFGKLNSVDIDSVISTSPDYHPNGCFYVFNKNTFLKHNKIFTDNTFLISMPWEESVDIDYEHELSIANALQRGNYV